MMFKLVLALFHLILNLIFSLFLSQVIWYLYWIFSFCLVPFFSLTLAVSKIISKLRGLILFQEHSRLHWKFTYPFVQHTIGVNLRLMTSHSKAIFIFLWSLHFWTLLLQLGFGNIASETSLPVYYFYLDYALSPCSSICDLSLLSVTPLSMLLSQ